MTEEAAELAERLRHFWTTGGADDTEARKIIALAVVAAELPVAITGKVVQLTELFGAEMGDGWRTRIEDFRTKHEERVELLQRVLWLGDPSTPPAEILQYARRGEGQLAIADFDLDSLQAVRIRAPDRAEGAKRFFDEFGWERIDPDQAPLLRNALAELGSRAADYQAQALFIDESGKLGFSLGVKVHPDGSGSVHTPAEVGLAMQHQAEIAISKVLDPPSAEWDIEWELEFDGSSIGLALVIGALVAKGRLQPDPLLASSGAVDISGRVTGVSGINSKLQAAVSLGMTRVLLAETNRPEALAAREANSLDLTLLFVENVSEIATALAQVSASKEMAHADRVNAVRRLIPLYGLGVKGERELPNAHRFDVGNSGGQAAIDVYTGAKGTVRATGKDNSAKTAAARLIAEHFATEKSETHGPLPFNVPDGASERRLRDGLRAAGAAELPASQGQSFAYRLTRGTTTATVIVYGSGKGVLQSGKSPAFGELRQVIDSALGALGGLPSLDEVSEVKKSAGLPLGFSFDEPHIGTDESGKGDYFGPLVSAAVFVDKDLAAALTELGVRDSKKLSDKSVRKLAAEIRRIARDWYAVTRIGPERFNTLLSQMRSEGKNLNTLLAWGHARSIEDLLAKNVGARFVVVDQFADARYIEEKILADTRERGLEFLQFPKAEADIAVAAASILARDSFLDWLEHESSRLGVTLPKGASDAVVAAARSIVATHGREQLNSIAKISFKTTEKVLA